MHNLHILLFICIFMLFIVIQITQCSQLFFFQYFQFFKKFNLSLNSYVGNTGNDSVNIPMPGHVLYGFGNVSLVTNIFFPSHRFSWINILRRILQIYRTIRWRDLILENENALFCIFKYFWHLIKICILLVVVSWFWLLGHPIQICCVSCLHYSIFFVSKIICLHLV